MKYIIAILTLTLYFSLSAQNLNIDSLKGVWSNENLSDTVRLNAIYEIAGIGFMHTQPDSAFFYAKKQYEFAKEKGFKKHIANSLNIQGAYYYYKGDFIHSINNYNESLKIREEIGDKLGEANILNNIGVVFKNNGNYKKALEYYINSLKIKEELDDKIGIAGSLNNIGLVYDIQRNHEKALEFYFRSLKIYERIKDPENFKLYRYGIANCLNNLGNVYGDKKDYKKAIEYHLKSLDIRKEIKDNYGISTSYNNIGNFYNHEGYYEKALFYCQKSYELYEDLDNKTGISVSLNQMSYIYKNLKEYKKAEKYAKRSLLLAQSIGNIEGIKNASNNLHELYGILDDYKRSLEMYKIFVVMKDSLENVKIQREVMSQEFRYMYDKEQLESKAKHDKELAISEQKSAKNKIYLIFTISISIFIFIIILYLFILQRKRQQQKENLDLLKKKHLEKELMFKSKELTSFTIRMAQNNQFLTEIDKLITDAKSKTSDEISQSLQRIKTKVKLHNIDKGIFDEFHKQFQGVHNNFISGLSSRYPELNSRDLRICSMMKMNMSSIDISTILGISIESLKMARYRINKKINLPKGKTLLNYLLELE